MADNILPFALEFPIRIGGARISFFVYENLYLSGESCASVPHDHIDYELFYTASGEGVQTIEGYSIPYRAGELLLIYPGEYHYQSIETLAQSTSRYSFRFSLHPPKGEDAEEKRGYEAMRRLLASFRTLKDEGGVLLSHFERVHREIGEKRAGYYGYVVAECLILFTEIIRLTERASAALFPSEELRHNSYFRNQIERFLRRGYKEKVTLADLAAALNVSVRQASRLVQQTFGMSFVEKLTRVRLEQAKFLLTTTALPLEEIAAECGFQSYSYFASCFRAAAGVTPTAFRKNNS